MAKRKKKNNQANIPAETLARARAELYGGAISHPTGKPTVEDSVVALDKPVVEKRKSYSAMSIEDLKQEYNYVIADLRSMFILAAILFVALLVSASIIV